MTDHEHCPAYLPSEYQERYWVGARDMFNPQIGVISGPALDAIREAQRSKATISLALEYRTADMEFDEKPFDLEAVNVRVLQIIEHRESAICFLCRGSMPFSSGEGLMWVWEYEGDGRGAGLDFEV